MFHRLVTFFCFAYSISLLFFIQIWICCLSVYLDVILDLSFEKEKEDSNYLSLHYSLFTLFIISCFPCDLNAFTWKSLFFVRFFSCMNLSCCHKGFVFANDVSRIILWHFSFMLNGCISKYIITYVWWLTDYCSAVSTHTGISLCISSCQWNWGQFSFC